MERGVGNEVNRARGEHDLTEDVLSSRAMPRNGNGDGQPHGYRASQLLLSINGCVHASVSVIG